MGIFHEEAAREFEPLKFSLPSMVTRMIQKMHVSHVEESINGRSCLSVVNK